MGRFFLLLLLMAGTFLLLNGVSFELPLGGNATGARVEGRRVVLETDQLEVRFVILDRLSDSFMVFGGEARQRRNGMSHATMAALPMRHARVIHARYPDFHMCRSPGAARAKDFTASMSFVAMDGAARDALAETVRLHGERVRGGGERTCVSIDGAGLSLESVRVRGGREDGRDMTGELPPLLKQIDFYLAEQVELADCSALLR